MVAFSEERFPLGRKIPTSGFMRSLTSAFTTADAAAPIMKAIARPMIPNVWRKSMNSLMKPFFFSEALSILSIEARYP